MTMVSDRLAARRLRTWVEWRDAHHGIAPTVREFAEACGVTRTPAHYAMQSIIALGWLGTLDTADPAPARAQYLTPDGEAALREELEVAR